MRVDKRNDLDYGVENDVVLVYEVMEKVLPERKERMRKEFFEYEK